MSAVVVVLLIGVLFLLVVLGDSLFSLNLTNANQRVPLGILGFLLVMFGGFSYGMVNQQSPLEQAAVGNKLQVDYPIKKIQVISPLAGDSIKCRTLAMGVYPDGHNKDIWVLLKPSDKKYYPQSDHTNTSYKRDGEWQVITRFGGDKGESYELIVYETDPAASQFFTATTENWKEMLSYPGLTDEELPPGAKEVDRIVVALQDNCRGVF